MPRVVSFIRRAQPQTTIVFDSYWRFAAERQVIYRRRVSGVSAPWTKDPVLSIYKFTNAYRAADRVSQYLIRHVIYSDKYDWRSTFIRVLLFKLFNKISTWELIRSHVGDITAKTFDAGRIGKILAASLDRGASIYSGAYIMPTGSSLSRHARKHDMHLELLASIAASSLPKDLVATRSMADAYQLMLGVPTFGPFLAFQFLIDLNYSSFLNFSEMDFVVPGPGARDGMRKCFKDLGDYDEADAIRWVAERQTEEFAARGLVFQSLWGRPLQLIDCQNLFCEVDKYARVVHPDIKGVTGRTRIKQHFAPLPAAGEPWFPPKWGLNELIDRVSSPQEEFFSSR